MVYTCTNCSAVAADSGALCSPCDDSDKCSFCGSPEVSSAGVCTDKFAAMKYVCDGCGRVSMEEGNICSPSLIS